MSIRIPRNCNGYQTGLFYSFIAKICHDFEVEAFLFFLYINYTFHLLNSETFFPTKMDLKADFLPVNFQFFKGESCQILLTWKGLEIEFEKNFRTWKEHSWHQVIPCSTWLQRKGTHDSLRWKFLDMGLLQKWQQDSRRPGHKQISMEHRGNSSCNPSISVL